MRSYPLTGPPLGIPFELNRASLQARGLIAWWPTLGFSGGALHYDRAARRINGTLTGGATWAADGTAGRALALDGTDDYADAGAVSSLGLSGDAAYSISVWVNPSAVARNDGMYFSYGAASNLRVISIGTDGSGYAYSVHYSSDHAYTTAGVLATGVWQLLTTTYNPTTSTETLYVNGVAKETWTPTDLLLTAGDNLYIGRAVWNGTYAAQCRLGDIRLYNRCLSATEVLAMYLPQTRWELYAPLWQPTPYYAPPEPPPGPTPLPNIVAPGRLWMPKPAGSTFQVWLFSPQGYRQQLISEYAGLSFGNGIRGGGRFSLELPPNFDARYVKPLSYVVIEECVAGMRPRLEDVYVVTSIGGATASGGTRFLSLEGPTATDYFVGEHSRVVAALEAGTGATYTDNADDVLKKFVKDGMGAGAGNSGTSEGRDLSVYAGFTVEGERGMGPSLEQNGYFRELDKVLAEVVRRSEEAASGALRLFYYVRPVSFYPLRFQFVVRPRLFGQYRGFRASSPVILSPEWGTISTVETEYDLSEGWNSVFVAYQGKTLSTRVTDSRRRNVAPHGFRETLFEATTGLGTPEGAQSEAQATLNQGKERRLQRFKLANSRSVRWGMYGLGDVVGVLVGGTREELEIAGYKVDHGAGGVKREIRVDAWEG